MPGTFDGAKLSVTKMLSSHFQVSHSLALNSGTTSGYKFGSNYVGTQLYTQAEVIIRRNEKKWDGFPLCRCIRLSWVIWIQMEMSMHK